MVCFVCSIFFCRSLSALSSSQYGRNLSSLFVDKKNARALIYTYVYVRHWGIRPTLNSPSVLMCGRRTHRLAESGSQQVENPQTSTDSVYKQWVRKFYFRDSMPTERKPNNNSIYEKLSWCWQTRPRDAMLDNRVSQFAFQVKNTGTDGRHSNPWPLTCEASALPLSHLSE